MCACWWDGRGVRARGEADAFAEGGRARYSVALFFCVRAISASISWIASNGSAPRRRPGPASPSQQPAWLANLTLWRAGVRAALNYSGAAYDDPALAWAPAMRVAPQAHTFDRLLFDADAGAYTAARFLDDLAVRYGQVDGVALWHSYPNLGVDDRSQFDLFADLPGGVPALAALVGEFHARGIKVGFPYKHVCERETPGLAARTTSAPRI